MRILFCLHISLSTKQANKKGGDYRAFKRYNNILTTYNNNHSKKEHDILPKLNMTKKQISSTVTDKNNISHLFIASVSL